MCSSSDAACLLGAPFGRSLFADLARHTDKVKTNNNSRTSSGGDASLAPRRMCDRECGLLSCYSSLLLLPCCVRSGTRSVNDSCADWRPSGGDNTKGSAGDGTSGLSTLARAGISTHALDAHPPRGWREPWPRLRRAGAV